MYKPQFVQFSNVGFLQILSVRHATCPPPPRVCVRPLQFSIYKEKFSLGLNFSENCDGDQAYKLQKQITNSKCKFFVPVYGKSSVLNNFQTQYAIYTCNLHLQFTHAIYKCKLYPAIYKAFGQ